MIVTFKGNDFAVGAQVDGGTLFNAPNQITRHCLGQSIGADDHVYAPDRLRQKDCRLTRGISATNHYDFFTATQLCLKVRSAIVNTCTLEARQVVQPQFSILRAGSNNDGVSRHSLTIINLYSVWPAITSQA